MSLTWSTASRVLALFAVAAALAACGGSSKDVAPTSTAPPSTTAAPATTAPTPTSPPSTTLPPTTTSTVDPKAKVIADFKATMAAFDACLAGPASCDVPMIAVPGSESYRNLSDFFDSLARNGLRGRPGDSDYVDIESANITDQTAKLRTCGVDAGVIYDPRGNEDPTDDVIVNDDLSSSRTSWDLALFEGSWRRTAAEVTSKKIGEDQCHRSAG